MQESTDLARLTVDDLVEAGCAIVQARKLSEKGWTPIEPNSPGGPLQAKLGDGELKLNVHILVRTKHNNGPNFDLARRSLVHRSSFVVRRWPFIFCLRRS